MGLGLETAGTLKQLSCVMARTMAENSSSLVKSQYCYTHTGLKVFCTGKREGCGVQDGVGGGVGVCDVC